MTVFSRHNLPEKGYGTNLERAKAFSTVIGGVIWMLVSISQQTALLQIEYNLLVQFLGSSYATGAIAPYISSHYNVSDTSVSLILPAIFVTNTVFIPYGSYITQKFHPKM